MQPVCPLANTTMLLNSLDTFQSSQMLPSANASEWPQMISNWFWTSQALIANELHWLQMDFQCLQWFLMHLVDFQCLQWFPMPLVDFQYLQWFQTPPMVSNVFNGLTGLPMNFQCLQMALAKGTKWFWPAFCIWRIASRRFSGQKRDFKFGEEESKGTRLKFGPGRMISAL